MRNQGFTKEDRMNQLPEDLILRILSFLLTELVIATSVLSKQWRSLWKLVPNLEFDSDDYESEHYTFSEIVCKSFLSLKAPVLKSLHLSFRLKSVNPVDIGLWIGIAFARHLRELVLYVAPKQTFTFPSSLCICNTLETLKLILGIHVDIPCPVLLKSLRSLHLDSVSYKDEESIRNLLSSCPILENLVVYEYWYNVVNFDIEVPSLKRLEICDVLHKKEFRRYTINVPCLKYLRIEGLYKDFELCLNAPELVEAYFTKGSFIIADKFLGSLKSAKRLSLDILALKVVYPTGSIFYQLVYLEMHTRREEWWNLLTVMLDSSPKLQVLKLIDHTQDVSKDNVVSEKWNEPKYVPECLLSHLETFVWIRYDWEREEEKEVATYILRNAGWLKKGTISTNPIESKDLEKLEERRKMLNELDSVVRASNSCNLVFEFE
ncbi:Leucine-rich repeat 2 [Arabidopsis thaliana x Arabidopsis arenosa]|uniref:F-box domain-containing protein n=2 Tax=Arabidopsis TaxID=3701 RepID=A0A178VD87_ARATH|nr:Leucine-rich repeat 2 [Arabidopsis thaliana x Arabidopsis arenosa]OAP04260.1 hypothetical protein AXX17_AT3G47110 [Arabidopsis thaliana]